MTATLTSTAPVVVPPAHAPGPLTLDRVEAELLGRVSDPRDHEAWRWFADRFGPYVYRVARRYGLQDADALDTVQMVMVAASRAALRRPFEPDRFPGWLLTAARHKSFTVMVDGTRRTALTAAVAPGDPAPPRFRPGSEPAPPPLEEFADFRAAEAPSLEDEEERAALKWRLGRAMLDAEAEFGARVWAAFWGTAVDGRPGPDVAAELGMSVGAVHVARCRVTARLRELAGN